MGGGVASSWIDPDMMGADWWVDDDRIITLLILMIISLERVQCSGEPER